MQVVPKFRIPQNTPSGKRKCNPCNPREFLFDPWWVSLNSAPRDHSFWVFIFPLTNEGCRKQAFGVTGLFMGWEFRYSLGARKERLLLFA